MSKKLMIILAVLVAGTCIVAAIHLHQQEDIACLNIKYNGQKIHIAFADLDKTTFSGQLTNGKGDTSEHTYQGVLLNDLLAENGIAVTEASSVTVTSEDHYYVTFTGAEILQENKVYAAIAVDGTAIEGIDPGTNGVQIIVFGDENSRRCVRYAAWIEVNPP